MKLKETKSRSKAPSYGKFKTKGIKVVGKWKQVQIDPNMFADGQMDDLVCFEELTDYQLVSPAKNSSSLFSKEEPKKRKAQAVSEGEEEGESSSSKKKMKLKKSKNVETEGTSAQKEFEVIDAEPEPQGDGTVCSDPEVGEMASESPAQAVPTKKKKKGKKNQSLPRLLLHRCLKKQRRGYLKCVTRRQTYQLGRTCLYPSQFSERSAF